MRQGQFIREYDPPRGVSVAALAWKYAAGVQVPEHAHGADQLIYATHGLMEVTSGQSVWVIPPEFALWIPSKTSHRIRMEGEVRMRTLYFRPGVLSRESPLRPVLHVTPLVRELILEVVRLGRLRLKNEYECALRDVICRQLKQAPAAPTFLTLPTEPRALAVAGAILRNPAYDGTLADLCFDAGASVRTVQRIFRREVGVDLDSWRRQARLTKAMRLLIGGASVKQAAFAVGYSQPSAFVKAFRVLFGETPRAWRAGLRGAHEAE